MTIQRGTIAYEGSTRSSNVRVALILGGLVLGLFLVTLWQFRPT